MTRPQLPSSQNQHSPNRSQRSRPRTSRRLRHLSAFVATLEILAEPASASQPRPRSACSKPTAPDGNQCASNWRSGPVQPAKGKVVQAHRLSAPAPAPERAKVPKPPSPLSTAPRSAPENSTVDAQKESNQRLDTTTYLRAQAGVVARSLVFSQDLYNRLRELHANAYVSRIEAVVYPPFRSQRLRGRLGFVALYEASVGGKVRDSDFDQSYSVTHSEIAGGIRARHAFERYLLSFDFMLDRLNSGLAGQSASSGVPTVTYHNLRAGLASDFSLGGSRARVATGFRVPLSYGEVSSRDWFPRVSGYGLDMTLAVSYPLSQSVSFEFGGSVRRFVLEMNPEPEDASDGFSEVAGGAIDSYLGAHVGLRFAP